MPTSNKNTETAKERADATKRRQLASEKTKNLAATSADHVRGQVGGFVDFIRTQGVIGLAVGLAIGSAAGNTVKSLVEGFINPIVQFIVGSGSTLATSTWTFEAWGREATFAWGAAVSSTITLIATALVIYWLVNVFKLNKLDKKKE